MDKLISIVIPVYNVEKYLEECLNSVINQTYSNIEIILVDDGSPDGCGKICDKYANEDNRIKVIHKKNGGLSDARNYGIDAASGEYITFIDSDDYVDSGYIEKLYSAIKVNNTKISQCGILKINNQKEVLEKLGYLENEVKTGKDMIKDIYNRHWGENIVVWNKMYSIELFKDFRYPVGKIHEDEYITYKILYYTDKIAVIDEYLYNYRQTDNSITGKKFNVKRLDILEALEERMDFFRENNESELCENTLKVYLETIRRYYIETKLNIKKSSQIQRELIKKYRSNYTKLLKIKDINKFEKIKMFVFYVFPEIYYKIKKQTIDQ